MTYQQAKADLERQISGVEHKIDAAVSKASTYKRRSHARVVWANTAKQLRISVATLRQQLESLEYEASARLEQYCD